MNPFEFRIYNTGTSAADIVLPDVETFTIAPSLSDVGTIQLTYPKNGLNYSQLQNDKELRIYYRGAEVPSLRATLEQSQGDDASIAEEGDLKTFNARMVFSHFDRAIVYPQAWPASADPPSQAYTSKTIGFILIDLIQKAQSRGSFPYITWSFTAVNDSNGNPWPSTSLVFNAQTNYLSVFQTMVQYALCDLRMVGYRLDAYIYQNQGVDHTLVEPPLVLRKGRDLSQAQQQNSTMGMSNVSLVAGDNNTYVEVINAPSYSAVGRREIGYSQNGVTDEGTLSAVGQAVLQTVASEVKARTLQLNFADPNCPIPGDNFDLGDWVYTDLNDGTLTRQRVLQWSISLANDGTLTGTVALDNIFQEKINRLNGRLNALQNGVTLVGSSPPAGVKKINFPPSPPTNLGVGSLSYQDDQGHTFAAVSLNWTGVTTNTNGDPEENLANYGVQWRLHATPPGPWGPTTLVDAGSTATYLSPFTPGQRYDFRVAAVDDQNNWSAWDENDNVLMVVDTTAPETPSTPQVSSRLGQLSVVWDGLDDLGHAMPVDFSHINVYVSASGPTFTPSAANLVGQMVGQGGIQVSGLTYNQQYWARFIAYDYVNNASGVSVAGSAVLQQVVVTDVGTGQVGLNNLAFSDVGNLIDNGSFEDPNWQAIRNAQFGGTHFSLDNTFSTSGTTSVKHAGTAAADDHVILNSINASPGQTFMGAADWRVTALTTPGMLVSVTIEFLNAAGSVLQSNNLSTCFTSPSTNDSTWRLRLSDSPATAPVNTVKANICLTSTSHTAGSVWMDNVEVRMQMDTLLIRDAAITDAKIGTVSANKIIAGTINAGLIIGGSIGTAMAGQRVQMDAAGLHAFDPFGNEIFDLSSSSSIVTLGRNVSGSTIIIDTSFPYPTLRFFEGAGSNNAFINALNFDGNTAAMGINSGQFTDGHSSWAYRIFMMGQNGGFNAQMIDDQQNQDGGLLFFNNTELILALAPKANAHSGQFIFFEDSTNGDVNFELDGYQPSNIAMAAAQGIWLNIVSPISAGTTSIALGYGVTTFSLMMPQIQFSSGNTSVIPGTDISAISSTGFTGTLGASTPGAWSMYTMAWRYR